MSIKLYIKKVLFRPVKYRYTYYLRFRYLFIVRRHFLLGPRQYDLLFCFFGNPFKMHFILNTAAVSRQWPTVPNRIRLSFLMFRFFFFLYVIYI